MSHKTEILIKNPIPAIIRWSVCLFFMVAVSGDTGFGLLAQDNALRSRMSLTCVQQMDESVELVAQLRYREEGQYYNINEAEVIFYMMSDEDEMEMGRAKTNEDGMATIVAESFSSYSPDEDMYFNVRAEFEGNEAYRGSDTDVSFKRAKILIETDVVDSVNTVYINTIEIGEEEVPIGDQDVYVMVPRMFSNLTLANDYSDEDGYLEVEIPGDIPAGDKGILDILVRIPDTDDYGTLEARASTEWGVPVIGPAEIAHGELWTPDAPLWMQITFVILMALVWGHFGVIIFKLFQIKQESNSLKKSEISNS